MKCPHCGSLNKDGDKFCKNCGKSIISTSLAYQDKFGSKKSNSKPSKSSKNALSIFIIVIILVIIAAAGVGVYIYFNSQIPTSLMGDNDSSFYKGDSYTVTLVDEDKNKLANKTIVLIFNNSNGENQTIKAITGANGTANLKLNFNKGNYVVTGIFEGDNSYKNSSFTQNITIKEKSFISSITSEATNSLEDYLEDYILDYNSSNNYWEDYIIF